MCQCVFASSVGLDLIHGASASVSHDSGSPCGTGFSAVLIQAQLKKKELRRRRKRRRGRRKKGLVAFNWIVNASRGGTGFAPSWDRQQMGGKACPAGPEGWEGRWVGGWRADRWMGGGWGRQEKCMQMTWVCGLSGPRDFSCWPTVCLCFCLADTFYNFKSNKLNYTELS